MSIATPPSLDAILRGKYDFYPILHISISHSELSLLRITRNQKGEGSENEHFFLYKKKFIAEAQHPIDNQKSSKPIKF